MSPQTSREAQSLLSALLLVAAFAIISPFLYEGQRLFPFQLGDRDWRFGAVGFLLVATSTPTLGFAGALALAWYAMRFQLMRGVAIIAILAGLLTGAGTGLFLMDYLALRPGVPETAAAVFQAAGVKAMLTGGMTAVLLALIGLAGLRVARRELAEARRDRSPLFRTTP